VRLRAPLGLQRQRQHRPALRAEQHLGRGDHPADTLEQRELPELILREQLARTARRIAAGCGLPIHQCHLDAHQPLEQAGHVRVGTGLDPAEQAPVVVAEEVELEDFSTDHPAGNAARTRNRVRGSDRVRSPPRVDRIGPARLGRRASRRRCAERACLVGLGAWHEGRRRRDREGAAQAGTAGRLSPP
jgi:hypothetical protein